MLEKQGRVRTYAVNRGIGWITFDDGSSDLPIYYYTLKQNGMEILRSNTKVLVTIEEKGGRQEITTIEKINN